jgi:glycerol-3-phosphate dehydrogenase
MGLDSFNRQARPTLFRKMEGAPFDLLIIGGGITGASIFRDAALRGMRVALVEAKDFASGTSGRSSKLIHGGLRYIKNLGFHLAWESCHERNLHIKLNKRLVRPMPFLVPLYRQRGESRRLMRAGMWLYDRFLSREETLLMAPAVPVEGLTGGCLYYDAVTSDSRWTIEIVKDGVRHGGCALNYAAVIGLIKIDGQVVGVRVRDAIGGGEYEARARAVVNATGVHADRIREMDGAQSEHLLRLSKGTHLVFAEEDVPLSVTVVFNSPLDGRSLFLAKHHGSFLYGTSDDWEEAEPGAPVPAQKDVEYLLASLEGFMPDARLGREKVQFVYSGFRPLLSPSRPTASPSEATREDHVETSPSGLISVVGGKLTTARLTAIRILERVQKRIGRHESWTPCRTNKLSIGGTNEAVAEGLAYWVRQYPRLTPYFQVLYQRYGLDAHEICAEAVVIHREDPSDPEPIRAEVEYVCRHEMVCTVEDLIDRRAGFLYWNAEKRLERLRYGALVIASELGLNEEEFETQLKEYEKHLARFHSMPVA